MTGSYHHRLGSNQEEGTPNSASVRASNAHTSGRGDERFRLIVENITEYAIFTLDNDGRVMDWNAGAERILGYQASEIVGEFGHVIYTDEDRERGIPELMMQRVLAEERVEDERWQIRKDGSPFWASGVMMLLRDDEGRVRGFLKILRDRTEQKRADEERARAEETIRFQAKLLDAVHQAVIATDLQGRIYYWNRYAEKLYGWYAREVIGRSIHEVTPAPELKSMSEEIMARLSKGERWSGEFSLQRRDGTVFPARVTDSPVIDEYGRLIGVVGVSTDITEQKRTEEGLRLAMEQAEEANRMKSVFLANMSHEIRTPLTAILGFASLLEGLTTGKANTYAERIKRSGQRLNETLDAVLTLARLEAGRKEMVLEPLDIGVETREIVNMYRAEATAKRLALSVTISGDARGALAVADRGALTSILQNLLANAIKFTPSGSIRVSVHLQQEPGNRDEQVLIHVQDTGIGISQEFMAHLFEPFMQESSGTTRTYEGVGLGLSIAKQLAAKMGAEILVESQQGVGSRFTVSLPHCVERGPEATPGESGADVRPASRRRLLLVEDDEDTRTLLSAMLGEQYDVKMCPSATNAIETAQHALDDDGRPFDLVISDLNLGQGLTGADVLNGVRRLPAYAHVPVAVLTAYALPGDSERLLNEGFDAYLRKPFTRAELLEMITRLLSRE